MSEKISPTDAGSLTGNLPSIAERSVWHSPDAFISTSTSPACGGRTVISSMISLSPMPGAMAALVRKVIAVSFASPDRLHC